jgi:CRISPR-associated protein Csm3
MANGATATLYGRVLLQTTISCVTGLHIGAASSSLGIGGVDLAIVRDPLTERPYVPGSSLRGKLRSLTEKVLGLEQNQQIGRARIHVPKSREQYDASPIGRVYGVPGDQSYDVDGPSRLVVRDAFLTAESASDLAASRTALPFSELKTEIALDRVTAEAVPRMIERLPAGAELGPAELVYSVYSNKDHENFGWVLRALRLLEDDYLGGQGSRGSGKVNFRDIKITARTQAEYRGSGAAGEPKSYEHLDAALADLDGIQSWLKSAIPAFA